MELEIEKDSTLIYVEDGACLGGSVTARGKKHIALSGGGLITHDYLTHPTNIICLEDCSDVLLENVTLTDNWGWNCFLENCEDVLIRRVHIIGSRGNSDGFDICGSRRVTVRECFTRVWDDSLVVKFHGTLADDLLFEKCVLWNDFARPIEVGVELQSDEVKNVRFRDIDIIHSTTGYPVMGIHHGDHALVHDIVFDDIRIEDAPGALLVISPSRKGVYENRKLSLWLDPGERLEKEFALNLPPGNLCIHLESENPCMEMSWIAVENALVLGQDVEQARVLKVVDCRGVCSGEVQLALKDGWLIVKSDAVKDRERRRCVAYFDLEKLGIEHPEKGFRLELALENDAPHRWPFTLFGSQAPEKMCHMFVKVLEENV